MAEEKDLLGEIAERSVTRRNVLKGVGYGTAGVALASVLAACGS
jgi:hypothetical protein